jgi:hypothetical protein
MMMHEIDRIVGEHRELGYNRQQFIESAVREKIEKIKFMEQGPHRADEQSNSPVAHTQPTSESRRSHRMRDHQERTKEDQYQ